MPRRQLNEALETLHQELEASEQLEDADREALLETMREIQQALHRDDVEGEPRSGGPLSKRISALIEDFETSHPRFAEILSSVSESLANLGI
jgi:hypothetical protein